MRPFLFNLFNDPAIIGLPQPLRYAIASLISRMRASKARGIYQQMGGKSPILELTTAQATALEKQLTAQHPGEEFNVFVCMRHWHPMSGIVAKKVKAYEPDHILLLPLYPQYSTTTTGSSFTAWDKACKKIALDVPTTRICCYPIDLNFIAAHVRLIKDSYWKAAEQGKPRILFSAHGLPEKTIAAGDPYQWQVERTVAAIVQVLAIDDLDYTICYQSRVGPMKWIGPSTRDEILRAGKEKMPLCVVPVSFVSEHSETLVELDSDYRKLAEKEGVPNYSRVPALGTEKMFIEALAALCAKADRGETLCSFGDARYCPRDMQPCPCT